MKPTTRPLRPQFSSGPCAKRPGWSLANLEKALLGRSQRSGPAKGRLQAVIQQSRDLLGIPAEYRLAIVPASDTGAVEMALWSLLGARGVDVLAWESFGNGWLTDAEKQLGLSDVRALTADYGDLPDLAQVDFARDVVFTWNGTTSGVRVPNGGWIPDERAGLTLCGIEHTSDQRISVTLRRDEVKPGSPSGLRMLLRTADSTWEAAHPIFLMWGLFEFSDLPKGVVVTAVSDAKVAATTGELLLVDEKGEALVNSTHKTVPPITVEWGVK